MNQGKISVQKVQLEIHRMFVVEAVDEIASDDEEVHRAETFTVLFV